MKAAASSKARVFLAVGAIFLAIAVAFMQLPSEACADPMTWFYQDFCGWGEGPPNCEVGGSWYWMRSPEQEKRVVMALFNRYCIRCHGVDGRGVWDIPDVPNFANPRWQASRTDGELARAILEGRGSVMPPWRGTLSLEEAWAIARYVRTFVPGSEVSRPDFSPPAAGRPPSAPGLKQPPLPPAPAPPAGGAAVVPVPQAAPRQGFIPDPNYGYSSPMTTEPILSAPVIGGTPHYAPVSR